MGGVRQDWFPTPVWVFDLADADALNPPLLELVAAERAADPAGMTGRSHQLGWHSGDDLHTRPGFAPFLAAAEGCVWEAVRFLEWDLGRLSQPVVGLWAVVNGPYASNAVHVHPHSFLSGVNYLRAGEGPAGCSSRTRGPGA